MNNKKYLNTVLTTLAVLLAMNLWVGLNTAPGENQAFAQGKVNAGEQRAEMINQLQSLGEKIDALSSKLSDGSVKVTVEGTADKD